jgi:K+-sensing histidine kinase KdpD
MGWRHRRVREDGSGGTGAESETTSLLRLEAFLERRSPGFVILLGLLLLALIGLVDAVTGSFDVSVFYLVPVALVTFSRGRWMGALMAGVATIARGAAEVARGVQSLDSPVTYWSALTRFYIFMAVVLMVGPVRDALVTQRELTAKERDAAEREREAAEQLRALNELRDALQHESFGGADGDGDGDGAMSELQASLSRLDGSSADPSVTAG